VSIQNPDGSPVRGFISCDGELIVLDVLLKQNVLDLLKESNIDLGKVSASCSAIHQPSDVSPVFKATKSKLKSIAKNGIVVFNPVLEDNIRDGISLFEENSSILVAADLKEKICTCLLNIVFALQQVLIPRNIIQGFASCGQVPLRLEIIMAQAYSKITPDLIAKMRTTTEKDVRFFLANGFLTEEQLAISNIPTIGNKQRDAMTLCNQRAVLISHPDTRQRQSAFLNKGLDLGNAILECNTKDAKKRHKAATQMVASAEKAAKKKEDEKRRREGLTAEERMAEKIAKKARSEANKAEKQNKLKAANELLGIYYVA
jgi:hypothetical protein